VGAVMNEFLKMDVFFLVTTVAVVLFAGLGAIVLWRLARILKHVEHVAEQIAIGSEVIRTDFAHVRTRMREGEWGMRSLFNLFRSRVKKKSAKKVSSEHS